MLEQCEECESLSVTESISEHDHNILVYRCLDCKAEWIDYAQNIFN